MKNQLERSLRNAVDRMPHPSFEKIAAVQVKKMEQMDFITRQETEQSFRERSSRIARVSAACLAFCFCLVFGGGWYTQNLLVYNIIDLDVNPSFELKTNKKEQVLSLRGCNEEAAALLEGTSYKNMTVDDAVESLIALLHEKNYISENQKTVLLTVGSRNDAGGTELKNRLSGKIKDTLKTSGVNPVIIRQIMSPRTGTDGKVTQKESQEWSVSEGKLQLIHQVIQNDPKQSMENLVSMPVEQLWDILNSQSESLPEEIEVDFDDDEFEEEDNDDQEVKASDKDESESDDDSDDEDDGPQGGSGSDDEDDEENNDDDEDSIQQTVKNPRDEGPKNNVPGNRSNPQTEKPGPGYMEDYDEDDREKQDDQDDPGNKRNFDSRKGHEDGQDDYDEDDDNYGNEDHKNNRGEDDDRDDDEHDDEDRDDSDARDDDEDNDSGDDDEDNDSGDDEDDDDD